MSDWPTTNVKLKNGRVRVPVRLGYDGPTIGTLTIEPGCLPQNVGGFDFYLAPGGFMPNGAARYDLTVMAVQPTKEVREWLKADAALASPAPPPPTEG